MQNNLTPLILALIGGALYALSAIFSKRALETGAGTLRSLFWSNWAITLAFFPFPLLAGENISRAALLPGIFLGCIFFLAQSASFMALRRGDASLVTSIMGSKSLFVAFSLVLLDFRDSLPAKIWIAASLAAIAVALLGWPAKGIKPSIASLILASFTAAAFGFTDALVPHYAQTANPLNLLFVMTLTVGILSITVIPFVRGRLFEWRGTPDRWMALGSTLVAIQAIIISFAIGFFNVPTEVNILYSSRGLWSILLVVWIGHRIGITEATIPRIVLMRRLIGATLLLTGIFLVPFQ
ncbi:MAG: EamA family transporter [Opitutae bacterium]|nr:EamA family transporter [Opitutae bacterium]